MSMTYEEAKAHLEALRLKQTRYTDEVKARSEYVKNVLHYESASEDATFAMLRCLEASNAREIEAFKPILKELENPAEHKMWSALSDAEKCTLALLQFEIGKDRFVELCKQGAETAKRKSALAEKKKQEKEKPSEHDVFFKMMRNNRNTYAGENL